MNAKIDTNKLHAHERMSSFVTACRHLDSRNAFLRTTTPIAEALLLITQVKDQDIKQAIHEEFHGDIHIAYDLLAVIKSKEPTLIRAEDLIRAARYMAAILHRLIFIRHFYGLRYEKAFKKTNIVVLYAQYLDTVRRRLSGLELDAWAKSFVEGLDISVEQPFAKRKIKEDKKALSLYCAIRTVEQVNSKLPVFGDAVLRYLREWQGIDSSNITNAWLEDQRSTMLLKHLGVDDGYIEKYDKAKRRATSHPTDNRVKELFYFTALPLMHALIENSEYEQAAQVCTHIITVFSLQPSPEEIQAQQESMKKTPFLRSVIMPPPPPLRVDPHQAISALHKLLNAAILEGKCSYSEAVKAFEIVRQAKQWDDTEAEPYLQSYLIRSTLACITKGDIKAATSHLSEITADLTIPAKEQECIGWEIQKLCKSAFTNAQPGKVGRYLKTYSCLNNVERPSLLHSVLLGYAVRIAPQWRDYTGFLDQWGVDQFREEDFEIPSRPANKGRAQSLAESILQAMYRTAKKATDSGMRQPMLAVSPMLQDGRPFRGNDSNDTDDSTFDAASSALTPEELDALHGSNSARNIRVTLGVNIKSYGQRKLSGPARQTVESALRFFDACIDRFPDNVLLHYYHAKLHLYLGNQSEASDILLKHAVSLSDKHWYWKAVADSCSQTNEELEIACLCKALVVSKEQDSKYLSAVLRDLVRLMPAIATPDKTKGKQALHYAAILKAIDWPLCREMAKQAEDIIAERIDWQDASILSLGERGDLTVVIISQGKPFKLSGHVSLGNEKKNLCRGCPIKVKTSGEIEKPVIISLTTRDGDPWDVLPWEDAIVIHEYSARRVRVLAVHGGQTLRVTENHWHESQQWGVGSTLKLRVLRLGSQQQIVASKITDTVPDFVNDKKGVIKKIDGDGGAWITSKYYIPRKLAVANGLEVGAKVQLRAIRKSDNRDAEWEAISVDTI